MFARCPRKILPVSKSYEKLRNSRNYIRLHKLRSRTDHAYRVTTALQKRSARNEETEVHIRVDNRKPISHSRTIRQKNDGANYDRDSFSSISSAIAQRVLGDRFNVNALTFGGCIVRAHDPFLCTKGVYMWPSDIDNLLTLCLVLASSLNPSLMQPLAE